VPEGLSTIPSFHVTTPSVVVIGVEFIKGWNGGRHDVMSTEEEQVVGC